MNIVQRMVNNFTAPVRRMNNTVTALGQKTRLTLPQSMKLNMDAVEAIRAAGEEVDGQLPASRIRFPQWAHYLERHGYLRIHPNAERPYEWLSNQLYIYTLWEGYVSVVNGTQLKVFTERFTHKGKPVSPETLRKKSNMRQEFPPAIHTGLERLLFS